MGKALGAMPSLKCSVEWASRAFLSGSCLEGLCLCLLADALEQGAGQVALAKGGDDDLAGWGRVEGGREGQVWMGEWVGWQPGRQCGCHSMCRGEWQW